MSFFRTNEQSVQDLLAVIESQQISFFHAVPSLFRAVCALDPAPERLRSIRTVFLGGEKLVDNDLALLRRYFPDSCQLVNSYGSSETFSMCRYPFQPHDSLADVADVADGVPAGFPLTGREIWIEDADRRRLAPGETGEVVCASLFLGLRYWDGRPLRSTSTSPAGWPIYRTGDRGYFRDDGALIVLGRADGRVKIRGNLVEPSEVEVALAKLADVVEAVVVVVGEPPALRLVAHVALPLGSARQAIGLREQLGRTLPSYLVPSTVVVHEALPRTSRGKVDRQLLVEQSRVRHVEVGLLQQPRGQTEVTLAGIWAEILGLDDIGRNQDLAALGADSLSVVEAVERLREEFHINVELARVASCSTIRDLAELIDGHGVDGRELDSDADDDVIELQSAEPETAEAPLICFAGGGTTALAFWPLTAALGRGRRIVVAEASGTHRRALAEIGRAHV